MSPIDQEYLICSKNSYWLFVRNMRFMNKQQFSSIKVAQLPVALLNTSSITDKSRNRLGLGFVWNHEAPTYAANMNCGNENWTVNCGNSSSCSNRGCNAFFLKCMQQQKECNYLQFQLVVAAAAKENIKINTHYKRELRKEVQKCSCLCSVVEKKCC